LWECIHFDLCLVNNNSNYMKKNRICHH
jgi:hypothetical protein